MFELKPMFSNLMELEVEPDCKLEWDDKDSKKVNSAIKSLFGMKTLVDHRGDRRTMHTMADIENFFGLPYTSSSKYAMVGNCNTQLYIDKKNKFNVEYFAIATDNRVVLAVGDEADNYKYFVVG